MSSSKIGVLGGTFDPIHQGHLLLAESVRDSIGLDEVLFIPTAVPPHKSRQEITPIHHRYEMVRLALENLEGFQLLDLEAKNSKTSYSIDTLNYLAERYPPQTQIRFILGADQLDELETWKDYQQLLENYGLYVVDRVGSGQEQLLERYKGWIQVVPMPRIDISSTLVRRRVAKGQSIRFWVPEPVRRYILQEGLYRKEGKE